MIVSGLSVPPSSHLMHKPMPGGFPAWLLRDSEGLFDGALIVGTTVSIIYLYIIMPSIQEANMPGIFHSRLVVLIIWTIAIHWTIAFPHSYPKYNSRAASCRHKIQYNEKSWNNTLFRASFQHKKEIPDLKLYQVWYLFWLRRQDSNLRPPGYEGS